MFFEAPHRLSRTLHDLQRALGDVDVVIGREMTKKHEEFLHGRLSHLIPRLGTPRGEYTVLVDIGQTTDLGRPGAPGPAEIAAEFGHMEERGGLTRREIVKKLAIKHELSSREVYEAVEAAKKSGD